MAIDGALLHILGAQLKQKLTGAAVDKVFQPFRDQLVFVMRGYGETFKLLLTCKSDAARLHITGFDFENPAQPPMLCMLARKLFVNARLVDIRQPGLERVLYLDFFGRSELGETRTITVAVEIMGRNSNIIFIDESNVIIDAVKRSASITEVVRPVFPGVPYKAPPALEKAMFTDLSGEEIYGLMLSGYRSAKAVSAVSEVTQGLSVSNCRELVYMACGDIDAAVSELDGRAFSAAAEAVKAKITAEYPEFCLVTDPQGIPAEYSFIPLTHFCTPLRSGFSDASSLLDAFYSEKEHRQRQKQLSADLGKALSTLSDRARRKLAVRQKEKADTKTGEIYREYGDYINSGLHNIKKGDQVYTADRFDGGGSISIPLNAELTPVQNAQRYYKLYRKSVTAAAELEKLISDCEQEISYLDTVVYALGKTECFADIEAIREELVSQGYLRANHTAKKQKQKKSPGQLSFVSTAGFALSVGKNNRGNDELTFKIARPDDIWLHVKNAAGSHVVIHTEGREPDDATLTEAAELAAWFSSLSGSAQVSVDYTRVRRVKKPGGALPGRVNYFDYSTAVVTPDSGITVRLALQ